MPEHEPLDLQPLINAYPTAEGERDLVRGKSTRIDFSNGIVVDVYASSHLLKVETPIALFEVAGLTSISVSPTAVEFLGQKDGYDASLTFFAGGGLVSHITQQEHQTASFHAAPEIPLPPEAPQRDQTKPRLHLVRPGDTPEPTAEPDAITVKGNFGRDPRTITTDQGQMYFYPFSIHYVAEGNEVKQKHKGQWVKVAVPLGQEELVIDPDARSETNPEGLRFREGDFTQQVLVPGSWVQLQIADKKSGTLKRTEVQGYFLKDVAMLKQKKH